MTPQKILSSFLISCFGDAELRHWLRSSHRTETLLHHLPSEKASIADVSDSATTLLYQHGIVDEEFLETLLEARPARGQDINNLRVQLNIVGSDKSRRISRPAATQGYCPSSFGEPLSKSHFAGERGKRHRRLILKLVRSFWIDGVLERALPYGERLELHLSPRFDAVEHPWIAALQEHKTPHSLMQTAASMRLQALLDKLGSRMLILGKPGAGKTTTLLELAQELLCKAELEPYAPVPVVLNLSSWGYRKTASMLEWIIAELTSKYNIPRRIAEPWVLDDELALLLDGLDEVDMRARNDCADAINHFCHEQASPVVICCRTSDYFKLTTRLRFAGAVEICPLTRLGVDQYLERICKKRAACIHSEGSIHLNELPESPLMLNIILAAGVCTEPPENRTEHPRGTHTTIKNEPKGPLGTHSGRGACVAALSLMRTSTACFCTGRRRKLP